MSLPFLVLRQHVETIADRTHGYQIYMGGTADGVNTRDPVGYGNYGQTWEPNLSVCLENTGDTPVRNPWIVINGKRDWRSLEKILKEVLAEGMSEAEKARAIWEFARRHRYHFTTADDEVKDTVKMLNVYGYTLCWDEAYTVANLWQAAGLKIRRGMPHGHCTTEVFFDGQYHLLDSDEHLLVLQRDNETIAGEEEIARDHDLMKRTHVYGILSPESRQTSEQAAALFAPTGFRAGGRPFIGGHRMDLTLRPGEALLWEWADRGKYHGRGQRPPRLANGRLRYLPRLDAGFARWADRAINLRAAGDGLVAEAPEQEAELIYSLASPYVMVGGHAELEAEGRWKAEWSRDGKNWSPVAAGEKTFSLDSHFPPTAPATYSCYLRLRGFGLAVRRLAIEVDLQMAPLSLPALELGLNQIQYTDESEDPRQVRITHRWNERSDLQSPPAPPRPLFPAPGAAVRGTQFAFAWEEVPGATDYHFELSAREDMKYVLSPTFEKLVSRTPSAGRAEWRIPAEGLLNPGQTYYWRVRARSAEGLWGEWSPVWSFIPWAPAVPQELHLEVDAERRQLILHWQPGPGGTPVDHYEIYGSNERGFTASRDPYPVFQGRDGGEAIFPANLLTTTETTSLVVAGPEIPDEQGNRAFYRVIAVDAEGTRSGPSDYAEAPRPFIYTLPLPQAAVGQTWVYPVKVLHSIGDLRCLSDGPHRYFSAFRDGDELRFILDEAPDFVALDERTGLMTARPGPEHLGFHTITFRVQNGQGGVDGQGFDLEVVVPKNS